MRQVSKKRRKRMAEVKPIRDELIKQTGKCMLCGASPSRRHHHPAGLNRLCCHEILNGHYYRNLVLDEPCCLIVCCWFCNQYRLDNKGDWELARQLAIIKAKAPERYDLKRVLELRNKNAPNFVTEEEVDAWVEKDWSRRI